MDNPKLFMSYSWSSPMHEQWVLDLAIELRESGVDVILDKWDLKEGHDSVSFMEKMVTDETIKKVAIISDSVYATKADDRAGGVGTETQIISSDVYSKQEQDKFVAVVAEKDENGKPFLPTYYKSRIFIDLSESDTYSENYEKFLRWIFDKPLFIKPEIGKQPSFIEESEGISLGTTVAYKRVISAIKENKSFASGAIDEYLSIYSKNIEKFRLKDVEGEFDDAVIENIERFIPYRNEAIHFFQAIAQYCPTDDNILKLHRFFETLITYMNRPESVTSWSNGDFDNFKFIVHELFLYAIAVFLKTERFEQANIFMAQKYYFPGSSDYGSNVMLGYSVFQEHLEILAHRNKRLELNRASLHADILKERSKVSGLEFKYLMQADFVLYLRSEISETDFFLKWHPISLMYSDRSRCAFEIFARSISKKYFERVKCLLNISRPSDLDGLMEKYKTGERRLPKWGFHSLNPSFLVGCQQLATTI